MSPSHDEQWGTDLWLCHSFWGTEIVGPFGSSNRSIVFTLITIWRPYTKINSKTSVVSSPIQMPGVKKLAQSLASENAPELDRPKPWIYSGGQIKIFLLKQQLRNGNYRVIATVKMHARCTWKSTKLSLQSEPLPVKLTIVSRGSWKLVTDWQW